MQNNLRQKQRYKSIFTELETGSLISNFLQLQLLAYHICWHELKSPSTLKWINFPYTNSASQLPTSLIVYVYQQFPPEEKHKIHQSSLG